MKRSNAVPLAFTSMLATSLTGCGAEEPPEAAAICVDQQTEVRVDDDRCQDRSGGGFGSGGFAFLYFGGLGGGRSYQAPPIGGSYRDSGGTFARPSGVGRIGSVSSSGGTVARGSTAVRGGFGGRSRGGVGGGSRGGFGG